MIFGGHKSALVSVFLSAEFEKNAARSYTDAQKMGANKANVAFDAEKTIQYWQDGAIYDLDVSKALYEKAKYPYALFMGHLSIEKLLKALVVKHTKDHAPFTHSLSVLAEKTGFKIPKRIQKSLIRFMEFHFEARYPEEQKKFYKKCTKHFSAQKMREIKGIFSWLKKKLETP